MSKINCQFKIKDLYAIKHALEKEIGKKYRSINELDDEIMDEDLACNIIKKTEILQKLKQDAEHEIKIVDYIVSKINKTHDNLTVARTSMSEI